MQHSASVQTTSEHAVTAASAINTLAAVVHVWVVHIGAATKEIQRCKPYKKNVRVAVYPIVPYIYKSGGACFAARPLEVCAAFLLPGMAPGVEVRLYRCFYINP